MMLRESGLLFEVYPVDDPQDSLDEDDTSITGVSTCTSKSCARLRWPSKKIASTLRLYQGRRYNARVYHRLCGHCECLSVPESDGSYADRVSYCLAGWSGISVSASLLS